MLPELQVSMATAAFILKVYAYMYIHVHVAVHVHSAIGHFCYIRWFTIYHSIMCCIMLYMFVERYSVLMDDSLHYDPALRLGSQYDVLHQLNTDTRQT